MESKCEMNNVKNSKASRWIHLKPILEKFEHCVIESPHVIYSVYVSKTVVFFSNVVIAINIQESYTAICSDVIHATVPC